MAAITRPSSPSTLRNHHAGLRSTQWDSCSQSSLSGRDVWIQPFISISRCLFRLSLVIKFSPHAKKPKKPENVLLSRESPTEDKQWKGLPARQRAVPAPWGIRQFAVRELTAKEMKYLRLLAPALRLRPRCLICYKFTCMFKDIFPALPRTKGLFLCVALCHPFSSVPAFVPVLSAHFPPSNDDHYTKKNGSLTAVAPQMKGSVINIPNLASSLRNSSGYPCISEDAKPIPPVLCALRSQHSVPSLWDHPQRPSGMRPLGKGMLFLCKIVVHTAVRQC